MPLPYLSFSAWWLYQQSPVEFYQQYYVGRVDAPTLKMQLGKIFQEAWSDPKYNFVKELKKVGFTSDYERIIRTAVTHHQTLKLPKEKCEKKYVVKGNGLAHPIMGIFDGQDKKIGLLVENKFGKVWTQQMADESKQITWYCLVWQMKFGDLPKQILLQSFNSKNGLPTYRWTSRKQYDIDKLVHEINETVARIKAGDFREN